MEKLIKEAIKLIIVIVLGIVISVLIRKVEGVTPNLRFEVKVMVDE